MPHGSTVPVVPPQKRGAHAGIWSQILPRLNDCRSMVKSLESPQRPMSPGGVLWQWVRSGPGEPWQSCRVHHRGALDSDGRSQGAEPRASTQEWARAIFEDQPAGDSVSGIHYRTAYGDGDAVALWDCSSFVRIRRDARGKILDRPLQHSSLRRRLQVEMWKRACQKRRARSASDPWGKVLQTLRSPLLDIM